MAKLVASEVAALEELQDAKEHLQTVKKQLEQAESRYRNARVKAMRAVPQLFKALLEHGEDD